MGGAGSQCIQPYDHSWCNYEAFNSNTIIIQFVFLGLALVLLPFIIYFYKKVMKYRKNAQYAHLFGDVYIYVYSLIFVWMVSAIIKQAMNIIIYYVYMNSNDDQQYIPNLASPLVICSTIFVFFEYLCVFCILFLMMIIPYDWTHKILMMCIKQFSLSLNNRKIINIFFIILKLIKYYMIAIRMPFILLLIIQPLIFYFGDSSYWCNKLFLKINFICIFVDTLVTLAIYIFCYGVGNFLYNRQLTKFYNRQVSMIKTQFRILLAVLIVRIILFFYFKLLGGPRVLFNSTCFGKLFNQNMQYLTLIYLSLAKSVMHFLPIIVVLYIYRPYDHRKQRESLHQRQNYIKQARSNIYINKRQQQNSLLISNKQVYSNSTNWDNWDSNKNNYSNFQ